MISFMVGSMAAEMRAWYWSGLIDDTLELINKIGVKRLGRVRAFEILKHISNDIHPP